MKLSQNVTLKDIAKITGLSTASVSQALRPQPNSNIKLHQDTVERVRKVAEELQYQPHSGARSIRSKSFQTIGYFTAKSGPFTNTPLGYLAGVHDVAEEHEFKITLIRLPNSADGITSSIPMVFRERNLDALIIESYNELADQIYDRIRTSQLPAIFINDRHAANSVYVDDEWGAATLTNHLISCGYQRIGFFHRQIEGGPPIRNMHHSAADRENGYCQAMQTAGRVPQVHTIHCNGLVGPEVNLTPQDWEIITSHDAVIAYDDDLANLIARSAYDHQKRIPDTLAIAGFNGDYASHCAWRKLTTMRVPSYEMGRKAAEMAFELIERGISEEIPSAVFRPLLVCGETT